MSATAALRLPDVARIVRASAGWAELITRVERDLFDPEHAAFDDATLQTAMRAEQALLDATDSERGAAERAAVMWNALSAWACRLAEARPKNRHAAPLPGEAFLPRLSPLAAAPQEQGQQPPQQQQQPPQQQQQHPARLAGGMSWVAWAVRLRAEGAGQAQALFFDMLRAAAVAFQRETAPAVAAAAEAAAAAAADGGGETDGGLFVAAVRAAVQWQAVLTVRHCVVGERRVVLREFAQAPDAFRRDVFGAVFDAVASIGEECERDSVRADDIVKRYGELAMGARLPLGAYAAANRTIGLGEGVAVPPGKPLKALYLAASPRNAETQAEFGARRVAEMCASAVKGCFRGGTFEPALLAGHPDWTALSLLTIAAFAVRAAAVSNFSTARRGPRRVGEDPEARRDPFSARHFYPWHTLGYCATRDALRESVRSHRTVIPRLVQLSERVWAVQTAATLYLYDNGAAALVDWHAAATSMYGGVDECGVRIPRLQTAAAAGS